jgi:hypothetical protein
MAELSLSHLELDSSGRPVADQAAVIEDVAAKDATVYFEQLRRFLGDEKRNPELIRHPEIWVSQQDESELIMSMGNATDANRRSTTAKPGAVESQAPHIPGW